MKSIPYTLLIGIALALTACKNNRNSAAPIHIVTLKLNGGVSADTIIRVVDGQQATPPSTLGPIRDGYVFLGWYTDPAFTHSFDFNAKITADLTLYAQWTLFCEAYPIGADPDRPSVYRIYTWQQLQNINCNPAGVYELQNDIVIPYGYNWKPLGGGPTKKSFTGTLDGNGYTVRNLYINAGRENIIGLVAKNEGTVKNIGVEISRYGIRGSGDVGGLVGFAAYHSVTHGVVSGGAVRGRGAVGGLVGEALNAFVYGYSSVAIECDESSAGGLVGFAAYGSIVGYATGAVSGKLYVGGLAGYLAEDVTLTGYATGATSGEIYVGGLVGSLVTDLAGGSPPASIVGYARGSVARTLGPNTTFGLVMGLELMSGGKAKATGYRSAKVGESALINIEERGRAAFDGIAIDAAAQTAATSFVGFVFGSDAGQWSYTANRWPAINLPNEAIFANLPQPTEP